MSTPPEHPHPPPSVPTNPSPPPQAAPTTTPSPTSTTPPKPSPNASTSSIIPDLKPPTVTSNPAPAPGVKPKAAPVELTGFRSALSHTGIPHSVLTWKPKLPSRNWLIFWTITATISGTYYYDRYQCKRIKEETIKLVEEKGKEVLEGGSLGLNRKIKVYGAKWPGDEDTDRALRYFRKYVKPYLVAAAIDYDLPSSPLHGSITRQIHAKILSERRQSLGLEAPQPQLSLPGILSPEEYKQKELEGGIVLVGRASLKEYLEGLKRGYMGSNGVREWKWEDEIEDKLKNDGVFDEPVLEDQVSVESSQSVSDEVTTTPVPAPSKPTTGLGFLSRPQPQPQAQLNSSNQSQAQGPQIPEHFHVPPTVLPPQPPILLLPFVNHIGFTQIPRMILSFFTERYKVKEGSEAALALINNTIRPFDPSTDLKFDEETEVFYNKTAKELPTRIEQARKDYYESLKPKIEQARLYEMGQRELTEAELKPDAKIIRVDDLKEERKKKELRWMGNLEGWDIVKRETEVAWDDRWDGWLNVFELPKSGNTAETSSSTSSSN